MTKLFKNIEKLVSLSRRDVFRNLRQVTVNNSHDTLDNLSLVPSENVNQKILKVAVVGIPNVGKSTFINNLMDRKVCPTSSKVHTTRVKAKAIFTAGDSQIVFLDTPGIINDRELRRHNLENSFVRDVEKSLNQANIIAVIHDVGNMWTRERLDIKVIKLLEKFEHISSFLVLNKIDVLKSKRKLLEITRLLTENSIDGKPMPSKGFKKNTDENRGWPNFKEVFMVSALTGNGLEDIRDYLTGQAKPGKWLFPEDVWTDQTPKQIIENTVKATLLDFLPQEIPYNLKPQIEMLEIADDGIINTVVLVECPTKRIATLICGGSNGRLRQIMEAAQRDLQDAFQNYVRIKIIMEPKNKSE